jgi:ubiquinone/menaquinone biosynthesis C-methylase UbiE
MTEPKRARHAYEIWAATYDTQANKVRDLDAVVIRAADLPLDGQAIIELGAGSGKNTEYLAAHARAVTAFDYSPAMLSRARQRILDSNVRFIEHDISRRWPTPDADTDLVVADLVLEHIPDLRPVFTEAHRVLRPQGLFFISELHPYQQLHGIQAHFQQGEEVFYIEAYPHMVSEYVNQALEQGFELQRLDEWSRGDANQHSTPGPSPLLLSMLFRR